jgi:hypothetical protein
MNHVMRDAARRSNGGSRFGRCDPARRSLKDDGGHSAADDTSGHVSGDIGCRLRV